MRRTLPPIRDLSCFEAVVRNRSVTRAAEELNLTQSAVSRRIASLEGLLGERLFVRDKQRLIPTAAAEDYADELRKLLNGIEVATTKALRKRRSTAISQSACVASYLSIIAVASRTPRANPATSRTGSSASAPPIPTSSFSTPTVSCQARRSSGWRAPWNAILVRVSSRPFRG